MSKKFQKSPLAGRITASLVVEFVNEEIKSLWGKKGAEQAKAISLKSQIVKITCANAMIGQEISFKKNSLTNSVNSKFGERTVKKIQIVQKGIEKPAEQC